MSWRRTGRTFRLKLRLMLFLSEAKENVTVEVQLSKSVSHGEGWLRNILLDIQHYLGYEGIKADLEVNSPCMTVFMGDLVHKVVLNAKHELRGVRADTVFVDDVRG